MASRPGLTEEEETGRASAVDPARPQYLIVTTEAQREAWQTYASWKTAKGVPAAVFTVPWIEQHSRGRDTAEKIRSFVQGAARDWGASYLLLAGPHPQVPARLAWAMNSEAGGSPDENDIPADLYYSDLDGDWEYHRNGVFGEIHDDVDLFPDLLVGRAPTQDASEALGVIAKFLTYERTPPRGYVHDALFFAEILWRDPDPYTDSGLGKDLLAQRHFGPQYQIRRLYESDGKETPGAVVHEYTRGAHLTNHAGHSNYNVMGCGPGALRIGDVHRMKNGPRYSVLFSIGCWAGAFDYDCIGAHFLTNPDGGAIAFVGNSRYGWGSPGNPGMGYSETFDADFYGAILTEGITQFGAALAWPKIRRIPLSREENLYRWHQYCVNLIGDPEMRCHLEEIRDIVLDAPPELSPDRTECVAAVADSDGALAGATLCLMGRDLYQVGTSDADGRVLFLLPPGSDSLLLTATAPDHVFAQRRILRAGRAPVLALRSVEIDDDGAGASSGNGDAEIAPGETLELTVLVHNSGRAAARGVTGTLRLTGPYGTLSASEASFGSVAAGAQGKNRTPYVLRAGPDCPPGAPLLCRLDLREAGGKTWEMQIPLAVSDPGPEVLSCVTRELRGNGDGLVQPGETAAVTVLVWNAGTGSAAPFDAFLSSDDPDVRIHQGSASTTAFLPSGRSLRLAPDFEIEVDAQCAPIGYGRVHLTLGFEKGPATRALFLPVGQPGFADDLESGIGQWTQPDPLPGWRRSGYRRHSGNYSWYCGTAGHFYDPNLNAALVSEPFITPVDGRLSFWCYYDVAMYGVDGTFVEAWTDTAWTTLDFLGSGGALDDAGGDATADSVLLGNDWTERVYALPGLAPGDSTRIRFRFQSDGSGNGEGFYVDDVRVASRQLGIDRVQPAATALTLSPAWPNPSRLDAQWRLALPFPARVDAAVFDPEGRLVNEITSGLLRAGEHLLRWDGRSQSGRAAPSGVYFLRLKAGEEAVVRKVVRIER